MGTAKKVLKFLLKWTLVLIFLALLTVGFSFIERGNLARELSYSLDLPTKEWWQEGFRQLPPVPTQPADEWHIISGNETQAEFRDASKRVQMHDGQVVGLLEAKEVKIYEGARVGSVIATESAAIYGGSVRQNVQAPSVVLAPSEDYGYNPNDYKEFAPGQNGRSEWATVYGNITGGDIVTANGSKVLGNVGTKDSRLDLAGVVQGDATGSQVILRSTAVVQGDVITTSESIIMEPGADVYGKIVNTQNKPIKIVKGQDGGNESERFYRTGQDVHYYQGPQPIVQRDNGILSLVLLWLPILLGILATLFVTYGFFSNDVVNAIDNLSYSPLRSLWVGFVTVSLGVPVTLLLFITIIGIPLSVALGITLITALLVGMSGVCLKVGQRVSNSFNLAFNNRAKEMLLGILLVAHLVWIPILGWLTLIVLAVMGLGSITMLWWPRFRDRWHNWRQARKTKNRDSDYVDNVDRIDRIDDIDDVVKADSRKKSVENTAESGREKPEADENAKE